MRTFLLLLLICTESFAQTPSSDIQGSVQQDHLVASIITRLELAREVAWTKFQNHAPVADLAREAAILTALKSAGKKLGLTEDQVSALFVPQIAASRRAQEELIAGWRFGSPRPKTPPKDLQRDIRPLVTKISLELLQEWKDLPPQSLSSTFRRDAEKQIIAKGFSPDVARIAASPLGKD
jgi:chorismate mutase-like protein